MRSATWLDALADLMLRDTDSIACRAITSPYKNGKNGQFQNQNYHIYHIFLLKQYY